MGMTLKRITTSFVRASFELQPPYFVHLRSVQRTTALFVRGNYTLQWLTLGQKRARETGSSNERTHCSETSNIVLSDNGIVCLMPYGLTEPDNDAGCCFSEGDGVIEWNR